MSQQIVVEASEKWKQVLYGHPGTSSGAEAELAVGRVMVPMRMAG